MVNRYRERTSRMQRTTPAPHNVMPLAIRFKCSGASRLESAIIILLLGHAASVMPLLGLMLPLNSSVRRPLARDRMEGDW
jgi:hypothetical protein